MNKLQWSNDEEFQMHMRRVFLSKIVKRVSELSGIITKIESTPDNLHRVREAERLCHSLRGSAALYGFESAADVLEVLELTFKAIIEQPEQHQINATVLLSMTDCLIQLREIFTTQQQVLGENTDSAG